MFYSTIMKQIKLYGFAAVFLFVAAVPARAIINGTGQDVFPETAIFNSSASVMGDQGLHVSYGIQAATITLTGGITASSATLSEGLIVSNGNVGLGTTEPLAALDIKGSIYSRRYGLPTDPGPGGTINIDWANGNTQSVTISATEGLRTFAFTNGRDGGKYVLMIKSGGAGPTFAFPANLKWPGGAAPTLSTTSGKSDFIGLIFDGTDYNAVAFTSNI